MREFVIAALDHLTLQHHSTFDPIGHPIGKPLTKIEYFLTIIKRITNQESKEK
jgi:hypothetical protein